MENHLKCFLCELCQTVFCEPDHKSDAFEVFVAELSQFTAVGRESAGKQLVDITVQTGLSLVVAFDI